MRDKIAVRLLSSALFITAYLFLDWLSYIHAFFGLNITPWNPALALGLACFLRYGRRLLYAWWLALLLGDIAIRQLMIPVWQTAILDTCLLAGYAVMAEFIRQRVSARNLLTGRKHLLTWIGISAIGTLLTSTLYILAVEMIGLLQPENRGTAIGRFWVGDFVGITVTMPFFWLLVVHRQKLKPILPHLDTPGYIGLSVVMLGLAFGFGYDQQLNLLYLLFLPLIWAAARQGVVGAAVAAFVLQAGIILGEHWFKIGTGTVFELQILGAALAFSGLFLGVVIDEKERIGAELRQTLRLAAAGEMAAALTHELNQPLTALSTYGAACEHLIATGETGSRLADTIQRMVSESTRASDVVRRLRDFFRSGTTRPENLRPRALIQPVENTFKEKAAKSAIDFQVEDASGDSRLLVDRLQLEVVLRNLLANAFDAVEEGKSARRTVAVHLSRNAEGDKLCIQFEDSGPGVSADQTEKIFETFHTTKASGMGLGLAISRAIVAAHGGSLTAEAADHGIFRLVLPLAGGGL